MGFDLNRHWANPSPWAHPTLHGVKQLIIEMYNNPVSGERYPLLRYRLSPAAGLCKMPVTLMWLKPVANQKKRGVSKHHPHCIRSGNICVLCHRKHQSGGSK